MVGTFFGTYCKFIQICKDEMSYIMEDVVHGPLEGGGDMFKTERHNLVCECTPRGCKRCFVLICMVNLNLVVPREPIHEG